MRGKLAWLFRRRLCFGGLAGALVFFCLALLPSLLPRGVIMQGVISGVTAVIGYGLGSAASGGGRKVPAAGARPPAAPPGFRNGQSAEPRPPTKRVAWWVLAGATTVLVPLFLGLGRSWQNDVR